MARTQKQERTTRIAAAIGGVAVIAVILWIDVATGFWQDLVILSGLAAGLVTFLLTVLVLDRIVARSTARRWAPINRLALSEFLHAIADEERSEIARGRVVPRALPALREDAPGQALPHELHRLRTQVVAERRALSDALSRWAEFLASSGDNETVLRHVAGIALRLDRVRDAALDLEETIAGAARATTIEAARAALTAEIDACNTHFAALVAELRGMLAELDRETAG